MCAVDQLKLCHNKSLVVLSGDAPLIKSDFIEKIISSNESEVILVTKNSENPYGYGRIVTKDDTFIKIVEEKDSSEEEKNKNSKLWYLLLSSKRNIRQYYEIKKQ